MRRTMILTCTLTAGLMLAGCGTTVPAETQGRGATSGFSGTAPVRITSCGHELTLAAPPKRVVVINSDAFPLLDAVDAVDTVVGRVGKLPAPGVWGADLARKAAATPELGSATTATGGAVVSSEAVLAAKPDLVIGAENGVDRAALDRASIPFYVPPAFCDAHPLTDRATFDAVHGQVRTYGTIFGRSDTAEESIAQLKTHLDQVPQALRGTTAAALNVSGSTVYAYGNTSMNQANFDAVGLTNVYGDNSERVFEISQEDIVSKKPEVLVLLYGDGTPADAVQAFRATKVGKAAEATGKVTLVPMAFAHADPATPVSVLGARELGEAVARSGRTSR